MLRMPRSFPRVLCGILWRITRARNILSFSISGFGMVLNLVVWGLSHQGNLGNEQGEIMHSKLLLISTLMVVVLVAASCSSDNPTNPNGGSIIGAWGYDSYDAETGIEAYKRQGSLSGDKSGYQFDSHGVLLVRSAGWCGTPPLTYSNYEGSWVEESEDVLVLNRSDLGYTMSYKLEIVELTNDVLRFRQVPLE